MNIQQAYNLLEVDASTPLEEVSKKYKQLLASNHPDKFQDEEEKKSAESKFKEIQQAFNLIKKSKEIKFNTENFNYVDFETVAFAKNWTFNRPGSFNPATVVKISFREAILGCKKKIKIAEKTKCGSCNGTGYKPDETGVSCPDCKYGVKDELNEFEIQIPPGVINNETIQAVKDKSKLIFIKINVEKDPELSLAENKFDVVSTVSISLLEALKGTNKEINTIKGKVSLKIPSKIKNNQVLNIKGYGVPFRGYMRANGNHLVSVIIDYPDDVDGLIKFLETN